jgi:uncharacterized SAM-binding protein YcdF (DUF218 family)
LLRSLSVLAGVVLVAAVAWAGGLMWFASAIPTHVDDQTTHTDAIVVLTGGSERIETGLSLLAEGLADRMFVSGVGEQVRAGDLLARTRSLPPDLAEKISVGKAASDTPGNALETAEWAHAAGVRSIRLVTAAYHMRRSLLEFQAAMGDVAIVPNAVFPKSVKTDWWRWPGTARLFAGEYTKFVLTWARQSIGAEREPQFAGGTHL